MSYIVDITQDSIKEAMNHLGIDKSELLLKHPDDYSDKDALPDIKRLRFNFIRRKQKELARRIQEYVKDTLSKHSPSTSKISEFNNESLQNQRKSPSPILKIKQKHQELVQKYLENVQEKIQEIKNLEKKLKKGQKLREARKISISTRRKSKMMQVEFRRLENIRAQSVTVAKQATLIESQEYFVPKTLNPEHFQRNARNKSELGDKEIIEKLQKFEEKMEKSKEIKDLYTNLKKNAASKQLDKVFKSTD